MVEVCNLTKRERPPEGEDWVLVEQAGGRFVANGSIRQAGAPTLYFRPPAFRTLDEAVNAARSWAFDNSVPVVYVK
jgi:hypothetical protein